MNNDPNKHFISGVTDIKTLRALMKNQDWLEHQVSFQKKSHHCNAFNYSGIADLSESPDY